MDNTKMDNAKESAVDKWIAGVLHYVAEFENDAVDSDNVLRMMSTNDSKQMVIRGFYEWSDKPTKTGWTRQRIMDYGAKCVARGIVMNKVAVLD